VRFSWFGLENQADFGLSVVSQNRRMEVDAVHASRSSGLLYVKSSLTRFFKSGIKTDGAVTAGGARGTITEVASESVEDGRVATDCVRPCYPFFIVFYLDL
jgi:hypothetical protein